MRGHPSSDETTRNRSQNRPRNDLDGSEPGSMVSRTYSNSWTKGRLSEKPAIDRTRSLRSHWKSPYSGACLSKSLSTAKGQSGQATELQTFLSFELQYFFKVLNSDDTKSCTVAPHMGRPPASRFLQWLLLHLGLRWCNYPLNLWIGETPSHCCRW